MACFDFQGTYTNSWFPDGDQAYPLEQIQSININEGASLNPVQGDNNTAPKSFTVSSTSAGFSLTDTNVEQAMSVVENGVLGTYSFKSDDKCLGGSGKTVTVTIESSVFDSRGSAFATQTPTSISRSAQCATAGNDGETHPVTYVFSV